MLPLWSLDLVLLLCFLLREVNAQSISTSTIASSSTVTTTLSSTVAAVVPSASSYLHSGCALEPAINGGGTAVKRALVSKAGFLTNMTVESCAQYCAIYAYMGVENGNGCFCGNTVTNITGYDSTGSTCNVACEGNSSQLCGSVWRMNLYANPQIGGRVDVLRPSSNFTLFAL